MSLVLGRNRRNREIRKLLVLLYFYMIIFKAKITKKQATFCICHLFILHEVHNFHCKDGHFKIQIQIALTEPRLLNLFQTIICTVWPWPPHSHHLVTVCPHSSLCCCTWLWLCLWNWANSTLHSKPPVIFVLSKELFFCLFSWIYPKCKHFFLLFVHGKRFKFSLSLFF